VRIAAAALLAGALTACVDITILGDGCRSVEVELLEELVVVTGADCTAPAPAEALSATVSD